jgi:putative DNA-invertase from lambdoid prophage Rac
LRRDAQDIGSTIKLLATRKIEVVVLQLGKLDLTSPAGKLMLNMLAAIAEMERDLLIERTQSGLSRAKSEGKILGRPSKTSTNQRAEILSRFKHGTSISDLAKIYGLSRTSILRVTKSLKKMASKLRYQNTN